MRNMRQLSGFLSDDSLNDSNVDFVFLDILSNMRVVVRQRWQRSKLAGDIKHQLEVRLCLLVADLHTMLPCLGRYIAPIRKHRVTVKDPCLSSTIQRDIKTRLNVLTHCCLRVKTVRSGVLYSFARIRPTNLTLCTKKALYRGSCFQGWRADTTGESLSDWSQSGHSRSREWLLRKEIQGEIRSKNYHIDRLESLQKVCNKKII